MEHFVHLAQDLHYLVEGLDGAVFVGVGDSVVEELEASSLSKSLDQLNHQD